MKTEIYTYHFEYETEQLSQECDNLSTAICLGIMDRDNDTGEFEKITKIGEDGTIDIVTLEVFEFIYKSHNVIVEFWQNV